MFDFFDMQDNYQYRMVAHDEYNELIVDTVRVTDGSQPFETAVAHPKYNDGKWVIVEAYDTVDEARAGHNRWLEELKVALPPYLRDCNNSMLSQMLDFADEQYSIFPSDDDDTLDT